MQSEKCKINREGKQKKTCRGKRWNIWKDGKAKGSPERRGDRLVARPLRPPGHPEGRSTLKNFPRRRPPLHSQPLFACPPLQQVPGASGFRSAYLNFLNHHPALRMEDGRWKRTTPPTAGRSSLRCKGMMSLSPRSWLRPSRSLHPEPAFPQCF